MAKTTKKEVSLDRRNESSDRRETDDRRTKSTLVADDRRGGERRDKVQRRRQIDPTTCERDYSEDEIEFMQAMDAYKRANGRMFPTCSEILEVLRGLGYERVDDRSVSETDTVSEMDAETDAVADAEAEVVATAASDGFAD